MTTIRVHCPNCGAFDWKYYEKYKGHGCRKCGFLWVDDTTLDGTPIKAYLKITKAGPPRCEQCGSIKVAWTHKFENDNSLLWICPNFCEFQKEGDS